jgi:hypothetical protein
LYVHSWGGLAAAGDSTLTEMLTENSSPLMLMSAGLSEVTTPATRLLNTPVPFGLIRTIESNRTFGPDHRRAAQEPGRAQSAVQPDDVQPADRLSRRDRADHLAVADDTILRENDLVGHHVQARVLRARVAREEVPDRIHDGREDGTILQRLDLETPDRTAGESPGRGDGRSGPEGIE